MRLLEFLISPIQSLYSPAFYKSKLNASLKYGFLYLLYLAAVGTVALVILFQTKAMPVLDRFSEWMIREMPEIVVTEGIVSSPAEQPYTMKHSEFGTILILDSNKESLKPDEIGQAAIFITKKLIYIHNPVQNDTQVIDLAQSYEDLKKQGKQAQPARVDGEMLRRLYHQMKPSLAAVIGIITFIYLFLWKLGAAFLYSLIAVIFNLFREKKHPYPALLNVTIYAMTAVCMLQLIGLLTQNLALNIQPWIAIGITTAYLGLVFFVASPDEKDSESR